MMKLGWALAVAAVVAATSNEPPLFANLLQRQAPGSPEYNCHQACGQAILEVRSSKDVCGDDVFLSNYESCLECAGPDNLDIWKFYGKSLTGAAASCGLSTTPGSGNSSSTKPTTSATSTSAAPAQSETTSSAASTTTTPVESTTSATPTEASTTPVVSTTSPAPTKASTTSESSTPTASASGSATTTGVAQTNAAARASSGNTYKLYYVVAFGALCASFIN
ncbi:hypothetical protein F5Y14DRAFT_305830 [Nemania sp. NC0429]|nr:hypothetical protein F5Y14DRAFT_305830 [Nemania sp. NC0429]